jgi:histidinol-phosphate aminotransferase
MKPNSFFHQAFANQPKNYVSTAAEKRLINFSSGEVKQPLNRKILKALRQISEKELINYPDPQCSRLKQAISRRFGISPNMITVGNGSDDIIENIPRVFLEPGEPCLFIVPTFFRFIESCRKMKAEIVTVNTQEKHLFRFTRQTVSELKQKIRQFDPKIIWIDSPNSVHGGVVPLAIIEKVLSFTNKLVVIDEVHHELIGNSDSAINFLSRYHNLVIIKSFSKALGLAGARVGFALANQKIIEKLERWRSLFSVTSIGQKLALVAILDQSTAKRVADNVKKQRRRLFEEIGKLPDFVIGSNSQTHLFLLKHKKIDLFEALKKQGILAADFRNVPGLEDLGFVRLNIKTPSESRLLLKVLSSI